VEPDGRCNSTKIHTCKQFATQSLVDLKLPYMYMQVKSLCTDLGCRRAQALGTPLFQLKSLRR